MNKPTIREQRLDSDTSKPILQLNDLSLTYDGKVEILNNISLNMKEGEFISIIGPSGCGKSSLLNVIAGFIQPTSGAAIASGKIITRPGPDRAVVFQDLALFPWLNVIENVAFGLKIQGVSKSERVERSLEAIELVGLKGYEKTTISDLSGGMKQRVAIARTIVTKPGILLMDEPFSALDAQTRELLQEELLRIQEKTKMTVILVTHSIDEAVYLSDRVVTMQKGTGKIQNVIEIALYRPRKPEIRVDFTFNEYKKQLMYELRQGYGQKGEQYGSGI
jgi:NitT/TauT family transport system ATP-binding protein